MINALTIGLQGCTSVLPGSMLEMRNSTAEEATDGTANSIPMECSAGSVVMWDGRVCTYRFLLRAG